MRHLVCPWYLVHLFQSAAEHGIHLHLNCSHIGCTASKGGKQSFAQTRGSGWSAQNKSKQAGRAPTTTADRGSIQDAKPTWRNTHTRGTRVSYPCPCFCIQQTQRCSTCVVWLRNCSKSNSEIIKWTASSECMFTTRTCVEGPLVIEERRIESWCIFHQGSKFARCNFFLWFWLQLTEEGGPRLILLFLMWFNLQSLAKG